MVTELKRIIAIGLIFVAIICCSDRITKLPDYWEYSPGKWIAFVRAIEIEWRYDKAKIDDFRIDRRKVKLSEKDIIELKFLINKKDIEGLISKEVSFWNRINFNEKKESYQVSGKMDYKETIEQDLAFGEIYFYQVIAIKKTAHSLPANLSVIILDRSK